MVETKSIGVSYIPIPMLLGLLHLQVHLLLLSLVTPGEDFLGHCKLNIMEAPVARVSSPVRNSRHRDSAPVQPCDQPLGSTLVIERLIMGCSLILNLI